MRIFFLNNYSMRAALRRFEAEEYPGHHLWGYTQRRPTDEWIIPPSIYDRNLSDRGLASLARRVMVRLIGDPIQEISALWQAKANEVVYAADQRSGALIGVLKYFGMLRVRYIVVVHHPPRRVWERVSLRGADHIIVLSRFAQDETAKALGSAKIPPISVAPWGPDLDSPVYLLPQNTISDLDFVAAGRTNRDYSNLISAAESGSLTGIIFDGTSSNRFEAGKSTQSPGCVSYLEIVTAMKRSKCIVIPLANPGIMAGLTEVADAIALGLPLLVSESAAFPYDLEEEGAGRFLRENSVDEILTGLIAARHGTVKSAASLAQKFNSARYGEHVNAIFDTYGPKD